MIIINSREAAARGMTPDELIEFIGPTPGELTVCVDLIDGPLVPPLRVEDPPTGLDVALGDSAISSPVIATQRFNAETQARPSAVERRVGFIGESVAPATDSASDADGGAMPHHATAPTAAAITLDDLKAKSAASGRMLYADGPGWRLDGPGGKWCATLVGVATLLDALSSAAPAIDIATPSPRTRWVDGFCLPADRM